MAGSFTSPSGAPSKMKHGRGHPGKESNRQSARPEYPITDSFAPKSIPKRAARKASSYTKSAFNTTPTRPSGKGF